MISTVSVIELIFVTGCIIALAASARLLWVTWGRRRAALDEASGRLEGRLRAVGQELRLSAFPVAMRLLVVNRNLRDESSKVILVLACTLVGLVQLARPGDESVPLHPIDQGIRWIFVAAVWYMALASVWNVFADERLSDMIREREAKDWESRARPDD